MCIQQLQILKIMMTELYFQTLFSKDNLFSLGPEIIREHYSHMRKLTFLTDLIMLLRRNVMKIKLVSL